MKELNIKSIRPFIGAKDFEVSSEFYKTIGFEEIKLSPKMSVFKIENFAFYLQRYYLKDWVDNSMLFLEVKEPETFLKTLENLNLPDKFKGVRLSKLVENDWGNEFFLHDPSGILWHIGNFKQPND